MALPDLFNGPKGRAWGMAKGRPVIPRKGERSRGESFWMPSEGLAQGLPELKRLDSYNKIITQAERAKQVVKRN